MNRDVVFFNKVTFIVAISLIFMDLVFQIEREKLITIMKRI